MLYFSEIFKKKVFTENNKFLGYLDDIIFLALENPLITKIVVNDKNNNRLIISSEHIIKINKIIKIDNNFLPSYLEENELFILKNLLDKQIIDIKNSKVVRVNDVAFNQLSNNKIVIAGVDIGILGLARRIRIFGGDLIYKLLKKFFDFKTTSNFLSWGDIQPLELSKGQVKLKKIEEKLVKIHPEDLADYLEKTNILNAKKILRLLNLEKASEVINSLNINYQISLFKSFKTKTASKFLTYIDPDEAVDILLNFSKKRREEIINLIPEKNRNKILNLLSLANTSIGNLITNEFITVYPEESVKKIINKIKKDTTDFSFLNYVYVINKQNKLVGVCNLHELILQDPETPIYKFMIQNPFVIHLNTPVEIALKKMLKYNIFSLPVVNNNNEIIGIITLDDLNLYEKI